MTPNSATTNSTTPNSTSTYRYCPHESFETFQHKVRALAPEIAAESFENVIRLPGGSFNRIIAADLNWRDADVPSEKIVLRIPRFAENEGPPNKQVQHQFAMLQRLQVVEVHVPRVLAYNSTSDNALGMPFSLQTRLEGQSLDHAYRAMTLPDRLCIADEVVRTLLAISQVQFPRAGRLCCTEAVEARTKLHLNDFDCAEISEYIQVQDFGLGTWDYETSSRIPASLQDLLDTQLEAWLQLELSKHSEFPVVVDMFKRLQGIFVEMQELRFFENRPSTAGNALYHWDLEPRNILVQQSSAATSPDVPGAHPWRITGVIDWDEALSVPPILARKPPVWLWDFSDDDTFSSSKFEDYDGDVDLLPPDLYEGDNSRLSKEDQEVKEHFELVLVTHLYGDCGPKNRQAYLDDAYGRGRWLRRLWRFALDGFHDSQHIVRFKKLDKDWSEYMDVLKKS